MAEFRDMDAKVNEKFLVIDKKLKDAFSGVKKDIFEIKSSLSDKENPNKEINEFKHLFDRKFLDLENELKRGLKTNSKEAPDYSKLIERQINDRMIDLKSSFESNLIELREIVKNKQGDNEKLKLEKQILQLKIKETLENQKKSNSGKISRLLGRIGVWKEKHKLNKQYRKQLEQINEKHNEFEQELMGKINQLDDLYSKSVNKTEYKFNEILKQSENEKKQLKSEFSDELNKIEKRYKLLIENILKKRAEDNSVLANQFSLLHDEIGDIKKIKNKNEKKVEELKQEKEKLEAQLELKSLKKSRTSWKLPQLSINSKSLKSGFLLAVPYIFLVILSIIALNSYFHWNNVTNNIVYWTIAGVLFGGLILWRKNEQIELSIEDAKKTEELDERRRGNEFEYKFPRINKIWGLNRIAKWMYQEGWVYSLSIFILTIISFILISWGFNRVPDVDEFDHLIAAKGIVQNGFSFYQRAPFINSLLAIIIKLFGYNLFWLRVPFILCGSLITLTIYLLGKKLSKNIGLVSSILWAISPWTIVLSLYIREYIIFAFLGTIISLMTINSLEKISKSEGSFKSILPLLLIFLFFVVPINYIKLFTNYYLLLPLFIVPVVVYLIALILSKSEIFKKNKILILSSLVALFGIFVFVLMFRTSSRFDFSLYFNIEWIKLFFDPLASSPVLWYSQKALGYFSAFIVVLPIFLLLKNKAYLSYVLVWISYILAFVFLFKSNDWFTPRYILYSFPIFILLLSSGIIIFGKAILDYFSTKTSKSICFIILILLSLSMFSFSNTLFALNEPHQLNNEDRTVTGYKNLVADQLIDYMKEHIGDEDPIVTTYFNRGMLIWYLDLNVSSNKSASESGVLYDTSDRIFELEELQNVMKSHDHGWIVLMSSLNYLPEKNTELYGKKIEYKGLASLRYNIYKW